MHQINLSALTASERRATSRRFVGRILATALEALQLGDFHVELDVISDARMKRINREQRGFDKATDVLSFPTFEGKNGKLRVPKWETKHLGSIIIAAGVARRQARDYKHALHREIARLIVHGVCHLAGYDHERSASDERKMFQQEDRILDKLRDQGTF